MESYLELLPDDIIEKITEMNKRKRKEPTTRKIKKYDRDFIEEETYLEDLEDEYRDFEEDLNLNYKMEMMNRLDKFCDDDRYIEEDED
jgi:hypothetical protein